MAYIIAEPCINVKDKACVEVCRRIGFPGESTARGGYPDYAQPQSPG